MTTQPAETAPYATPATHAAHSTPRPTGGGWLATTVLFAGLGLVVLAGCFMIGAMSVVSPSTMSSAADLRPLTAGETGFVFVLYVIVAGCLGGAALLITIGTRSLLRLIG
jgi:hypothetical protein